MSYWDALTAVATSVLCVVGLWQLFEIKHEAKKDRTLKAAIAYNTDPIIDLSTKSLRTAKRSGEFAKDPALFHTEAVTVLNYLDTIAIGIEQKLFVEAIACDHLRPMVKYHCRELLNTTALQAFNLELDDFAHLVRLRDRWERPPTQFRG